MKKRNIAQSFTDIISSQKKSTHDLNPNQKSLIDSTIPEALASNELDIVYYILNGVFKPERNAERKFDKLITHDQNKIIYWALEHENLELINYMIDRASPRGKFLIVCLNNYELLDRLLQTSFKKLSEGHYNEQFFKDVYSSFLKVNPEEVSDKFNYKLQSYVVPFPEQSAKLLNSLAIIRKELEDQTKSKLFNNSLLDNPQTVWEDKFKNCSSNKAPFAGRSNG